MNRLALTLAGVLLFTACPPPGKCDGVDCGAGKFCDPQIGLCRPIEMMTGGGGEAGGSGEGGGTAGGGAAGGAAGGSAGGTAGGGSAGGSPKGGGSGGSGGGAPGSVGDSCANPRALAVPGMVNGTTAGKKSSYLIDDLGGCSAQDVADTGAPDQTYGLTIPARSRVTVTVNTAWDSVINLVGAPPSSCGTLVGGLTEGITCLVGADDATSGDEVLTWANSTAMPEDVFLLVDGYGAAESGAFTITTTVMALPQGDVCSDPVLLSGTMMLTGQTIATFSNDYSNGPGCSLAMQANDRVYQVTVPPGNRLTASVTPDVFADGGAMFNPSINLIIGACPGRLTCVNGTNGNDPAGTDTVLYDNVGTAAETVMVEIDTNTVDPTGTFKLDVQVAATVFLAGESCGNAGPAAISTPTRLTAQSLASYANNYNPRNQAACRYGGGNDRVYLVDIPPATNLKATAWNTLDAGFDLALTVADNLASCGAGPCLAGTDVVGNGSEQVTWGNIGAATQRVKVIVDSKVVPATDTFTLDLSFASPPAADHCGNVGAPITATTTKPTESLVGYATNFNGPAPRCVFAAGPDKVYPVAIPPLSRVTATARATGTGDLALYFIEAPAAMCPTAGCVASINVAGAGALETLALVNGGTAVRSVFLVVDRVAGAPPAAETYNLGVTFAALPPGDVCGNATPITSSPLTAQSTATASNDYAPLDTSNCSDAVDEAGPDRVYSIDVPAGKTLSATVTPTGVDAANEDPALYFILAPASSCVRAPAMCLGGADMGGAGELDTATYRNSTAATQTVFIVIDSAVDALTGFSLATTVN